MSELAALTNGPETVIPGYIMSRPRFVEIGMAEREFARMYFEMVSSGSAGFPAKIAESVALDAKNDILLAKFSWGAPVFNLWAMSRSSLPYLTWLTLRVKHPQVTLEQVASWYAGSPINQQGQTLDPETVASRTWELFGYGLAPAKKNGAEAQSQSSPTGSESSTDVAAPPPQVSDSAQNNSAT